VTSHNIFSFYVPDPGANLGRRCGKPATDRLSYGAALFRGTDAVYWKKHTEHINTLCWQEAEFYYVKADDIYSKHWVLNGEFS
jgi:hypothetical protein